MNYPKSLICALCAKQAITTAAHVPVCLRHRESYDEEGRRYLPYHARLIYQALVRGMNEAAR